MAWWPLVGAVAVGVAATGVLRHALAVVAHPDDESFGLGGVVDLRVRGGAGVSVLCFTHGEGRRRTAGGQADLFEIRRAELAAAATVLGETEHLVALRPDLPGTKVPTVRAGQRWPSDRSAADSGDR